LFSVVCPERSIWFDLPGACGGQKTGSFTEWKGRTISTQAGGNERERSNEPERIANEWFTSRGVAGHVKDRQDGWRTTNTRASVHGKTFDVPFDNVELLT
jgi:hypothetical protein